MARILSLQQHRLWRLFIVLLLFLANNEIEVSSIYAYNPNPHPFTLPRRIDVYYYDTGAPRDLNVPLGDYVKAVVPNEWPGDSGPQALRAGAVAARTYIGNSENWWALADDGDPKVWDSAQAQVYNPDTPRRTAETDEAVDDTSDIYAIYDGEGDWSGPSLINYNNVVNAMHDTEQGDPTLGIADHPYLSSVSDPVHAGLTRTGHGWGTCQAGTRDWENAYGWTWQQMLYHYYTFVDFQQLYSAAGSYYNGQFGVLVSQRTDEPINFDWGTSAPIAGLNSDDFSVRWFDFEHFDDSDWYTFYVTVDGAVRLWVDDHLVIDEWYDDQTRRSYSAAVFLTEGFHTIDMDYYDAAGDALVRVSWLRGQGLVGDYFTNTTFPGGSPAMKRIDVPIRYNWPEGMSPKTTYPDRVVSTDQFAVRWEGNLWASPPGQYSFVATTDDGIRLWIDDQLVINAWYDQPPTSHSVIVNLSTGLHSIRMEMYENAGGAVASLGWTSPFYLPLLLKNYP